MTEEFINFKNFQRSQVRHWFDFPSEYKNKTVHFYASDNEETFDKNASMDWKVQGGETPTSHITQDRTYTKDQITYKFNSEGFRGPEIKPSDAEYKVLHYGGSFSFGSGLNEDEIYIHHLDQLLKQKYSSTHYWNISPANTMFEVVTMIEEHIAQLEPNAIVISAPRFIQPSDFMTKAIKKTSTDKEIPKVFLDVKMQTKLHFRDIMFRYFNLICSQYNIKIIMQMHQYKMWIGFEPKIKLHKNLINMKIENSDFIDLARDCRHPGTRSHKKIAQEIFKLL